MLARSAVLVVCLALASVAHGQGARIVAVVLARVEEGGAVAGGRARTDTLRDDGCVELVYAPRDALEGETHHACFEPPVVARWLRRLAVQARRAEVPPTGTPEVTLIDATGTERRVSASLPAVAEINAALAPLPARPDARSWWLVGLSRDRARPGRAIGVNLWADGWLRCILTTQEVRMVRIGRAVATRLMHALVDHAGPRHDSGETMAWGLGVVLGDPRHFEVVVSDEAYEAAIESWNASVSRLHLPDACGL